MGWGVVLALMLLQLKLCIIGFAVATQSSKGFIISSSPISLPVVPPGIETLGPINHGDSWGNSASSLPSNPYGSFFHPTNTLLPPAPSSAPTPQRSNDIESSISPSSSPIALSSPYEVVPSPSTVQANMPPSVKSSPPQRKAPFVRPPISPPTSQASVPSPMSTPSRIINPEMGGTPVAAPLYKPPKPLPAVIPSPTQGPAAQKARQSHHAPEPSSSSPESPSNEENHSPALAPSVSFYRHHHTRNIITVPAPASSNMLSPKASPSGSSFERPKTPLSPQVQALPSPPPNEDCLSTVCIEPYVNSPPGVPCRCVRPMRVALRLSISLYTFFPLVSVLASEISTGILMKQSQVRIVGANAANQHPDKTIVLIDLMPLGEKFDYTTASLTSDRFWHKKFVIKASYFGDYEVLYVKYPGLPLSPPLPPSSSNTMIDGGPYSTDGNNGRTIKPLGVDIQKRQHRGELSSGIIAIFAVSVFVAVVLCTAAALTMFKFRDHVSQPESTTRLSPPSLTKAPGNSTGSLIGDGGVGSVSSSFQSSAYTGSVKTFSMNDIEKATDNFHASRILGEGGSGLVYSGFLGEGTKVAVKVLKRNDHQGDREFFAEVEMLSRLHHRNLVKLIGICGEGSFRCLVYELIPNGSLESHLHGVDIKKSTLDWGVRMKIALGTARGLAYLHEDSNPCVIHRDFKSSNILLEDDFTPKVSDFGLARTALNEDNKHKSKHVMGTFGYVAPEYAMTGHLLVESDVYSYGVVLLELLTGKKPVDLLQAPGQENLVAWARPLLTSKEGLEAIIDPSLVANVPFDSVAKIAAIASMCVQPEASNRPFMGEVVQALKLVYNECEEAKEDACKRNSSQEEDLSVDLDVGINIGSVSGQLQDNFHNQFSATNFDSSVDIERGLSTSELFSSSARIGRVECGSFRRNSFSGPLGTGRSKQLWQIMRRLSGGSLSEHGVMFK